MATKLKGQRGATFRKKWGLYAKPDKVLGIATVTRGFPTIIECPGHGLPGHEIPVALVNLGPLSTVNADGAPSFAEKDRVLATRIDDATFSVLIDSTLYKAFKVGTVPDSPIGYLYYTPPKNLTGYIARAHFRASVDAPDPPLLALTHTDGIALGDTEGTIDMTLTDERTRGMPEDFTVWSLELESPVGDVQRFDEGTLELTPEVTHGPDDDTEFDDGSFVGPPGPIGPPGPPGPLGPVGPVGPASSTMVFFYTADANAIGVADPGSGKMRWNAADQMQASILVFDWLTADGFDPTQLFMASAIDSTIVIQDKDFSLTWQKWRITGPGENLADFFAVPVELIASSSPAVQFAHNKAIAVILQLHTPSFLET